MSLGPVALLFALVARRVLGSARVGVALRGLATTGAMSLLRSWRRRSLAGCSGTGRVVLPLGGLVGPLGDLIGSGLGDDSLQVGLSELEQLLPQVVIRETGEDFVDVDVINSQPW